MFYKSCLLLMLSFQFSTLIAVDAKTQQQWSDQDKLLQQQIDAKRIQNVQLEQSRIDQQIQNDRLQQQRIQNQIIQRKIDDQRWYNQHH